MNKFLLGAAIVIAALCVMAGGGSSTADAGSFQAERLIDSREWDLIDLMNAYRWDNGGNEYLEADPFLNLAVIWHVKDMGDNNYESDTDTLGRSPSQRSSAAGYSYTTADIHYTNTAGPTCTVADTAAEAWTYLLNETDIESDLANDTYTNIGVGAYCDSSTFIWEVAFGTNSGNADSDDWDDAYELETHEPHHGESTIDDARNLACRRPGDHNNSNSWNTIDVGYYVPELGMSRVEANAFLNLRRSTSPNTSAEIINTVDVGFFTGKIGVSWSC